MYVTSFLSKFHGHMFISLKVISALQKKRKRRDEKKVNKKINKVMIQLLKSCVSLSISSASLVPFCISKFINKLQAKKAFLCL